MFAGLRRDGRPARDLDPMRRMMPFVLGSRNQSVVYFEQTIDARGGLAWINRFRDTTGRRATWLHLLLWAATAALDERPRLNRFVAGNRIYEREGIWISFSAKKAKSDAHPVVTVKQQADPAWSLADWVTQLEAGIVEARSDRESATDREVRWLLRLPTPVLGLVVRLARRLDAWNLLPPAMIRSDPLFASLFVAHLGSIGLEAAYHHLFEYGNIPLFVTMGRVGEEPRVTADGSVEVVPVMRLRWSFDERIEDGLYCARALELLAARIEHPENWLTDDGQLRG